MSLDVILVNVMTCHRQYAFRERSEKVKGKGVRAHYRGDAATYCVPMYVLVMKLKPKSI